MQIKKVRKNTMYKVLSKFLEDKDKEDHIGSYLLGKYHIQISKYKQTTNQRVKLLYDRRRKNKQCIRCSERVTDKNPKTKKLYRLCKKHRKIERSNRNNEE